MMTARSDSVRASCVRLVSFDLLHLKQLQVWPGGFQRAVMRAQFGVGDEHVDARVAQNIVHLVGFQEIVDRHCDRTCLENAK